MPSAGAARKVYSFAASSSRTEHMTSPTLIASPPRVHRAGPARSPSDVEELLAQSRLTPEASCAKLGSSFVGLTPEESERRLKSFGLNLVTRERRPTIAQEIWRRANNPLNGLLLTLAVVSYFLG